VYKRQSDPQTIAALQEGIRESRRPITPFKRDLFLSPLGAQDLNNYDAIVIDPPRAGCEAQTITLAQSRAPVIIYVSCNPQTFARDVKTLVDGGYKLETVIPVDQFAWSPHIELVGVLKR
jgi:23S rRNA (uracil1939-C5)-methyltransferase